MRKLLSSLATGTIFTIGFLCLPEQINAQACMGNHTGNGGTWAAVTGATSQDSWGAGFVWGHNLDDPLAFRTSFMSSSARNTDVTADGIEGEIAYEVLGGGVGQLSVCPTVALRRSWVAEDGGVPIEGRGWSWAGGVRVGALTSVGGERGRSQMTTPFASFQVVRSTSILAPLGTDRLGIRSATGKGFLLGSDIVPVGPMLSRAVAASEPGYRSLGSVANTVGVATVGFSVGNDRITVSPLVTKSTARESPTVISLKLILGL